MKESQIKAHIEKDLVTRYPKLRVSLQDAANELEISYSALSKERDIERFQFGKKKYIRTDVLASVIADRMLITCSKGSAA